MHIVMNQIAQVLPVDLMRKIGNASFDVDLPALRLRLRSPVNGQALAVADATTTNLANLTIEVVTFIANQVRPISADTLIAM